MSVNFPNKKYNVIYADPPWQYSNTAARGAAENHYIVQSEQWIKDLPVKSISADTCALFLWVTYPNLKTGIETLEAWGFSYATCAFTWVKKNRKSDSYFMGCGNYTRANAEICLLGTKGSCQKMRKSRSVRQVCDARIERHSKKPDEIRDRIVALFGDVPRIELFARNTTPGWDVWGNEV